MKNKLNILLISSILLGFAGIVGIIITALNDSPNRILWGWITLSMIIVGTLGLLIFIILYIVKNKEKIKDAVNKVK